jgi:hypothetical protein
MCLLTPRFNTLGMKKSISHVFKNVLQEFELNQSLINEKIVVALRIKLIEILN